MNIPITLYYENTDKPVEYGDFICGCPPYDDSVVKSGKLFAVRLEYREDGINEATVLVEDTDGTDYELTADYLYFEG